MTDYHLPRRRNSRRNVCTYIHIYQVWRSIYILSWLVVAVSCLNTSLWKDETCNSFFLFFTFLIFGRVTEIGHTLESNSGLHDDVRTWSSVSLSLWVWMLLFDSAGDLCYTVANSIEHRPLIHFEATIEFSPTRWKHLGIRNPAQKSRTWSKLKDAQCTKPTLIRLIQIRTNYIYIW